MVANITEHFQGFYSSQITKKNPILSLLQSTWFPQGGQAAGFQRPSARGNPSAGPAGEGQPTPGEMLRVLTLLSRCRYARLQEWNYFHEFSDTVKNLVPRRTPTALYYEGISRFLEGQVLHLQKKIEEQPSSAQESGAEALKVRPPLCFLGWIPPSVSACLLG